MAATAGENLQATLAEQAHWHGAGAWSIGCWLDSGLREVPLLVVIDAKGLWTKIQAEYKTDKKGTLYIRRLVEILARTRAKVFWVNS